MTPFYERDGISIYLGDCREVLPTLPPADLVLTDPPYGVREVTDRATRISSVALPHGGTPRHPTWPAIVGDDQPFDPAPWLDFPCVILWGANHYADRLPPSAAWLVWDKREGGTPDDNADCEMAWTNLRGSARLYHHLWRGMVCRGEENGKRRLHPAQKPTALMHWCLERAGLRPNALVLDPYMGSGPVLVAAQRLGLRAIGVEVNEAYCETAARRLSQMVLPLGVA